MCYYDSVNDWVKHMNGDLLFHNKPPFLSASAGYWCALFMQSSQAGSISASIDYYGNTVGGNRTNHLKER